MAEEDVKETGQPEEEAQERKQPQENEAQEAQAVAEEASENAEQPQEVEEIERLKSEVAVKDKEKQELTDRVKRLQADFDNFRRRTRQEKEELSAIVIQGMIKDLLPLLDNFERALAVEAAKDADGFKNGIEMIFKQFYSILEKNGLEKIEAAGQKFDPNFHEAIMRVADATKEDDTVAEELQCGYSVRGKVIRPSMVKVVGN